MTWKKIDIFITGNSHLILVSFSSSMSDFSVEIFVQMELHSQVLIQRAQVAFKRYSWVMYFDPAAEVLTKHIHFFQTEGNVKKPRDLTNALDPEVDNSQQANFVLEMQDAFKI